MRKPMGKTCENAGILKRAGKGLVMDIAGAEFFLVEDDLCALMSNQMADVVNHVGEMQGLSWLSPLISAKKIDMTSLIDRHVYTVNYRDFDRVLRGNQRQTMIKEYHPQSPVTN
jgi:hypothetical protein